MEYMSLRGQVSRLTLVTPISSYLYGVDDLRALQRAINVLVSLVRRFVALQGTASSVTEHSTEKDHANEGDGKIPYRKPPIESPPISSHGVTLRLRKTIFQPPSTNDSNHEDIGQGPRQKLKNNPGAKTGSTESWEKEQGPCDVIPGEILSRYVVCLRDIGTIAVSISSGQATLGANRASILPLIAFITSFVSLTQTNQIGDSSSSREGAYFLVWRQCSYWFRQLDKDPLLRHSTESAAADERMLGLWRKLLEASTEHIHHTRQDAAQDDRRPSITGFLYLPAEVRNAIYSCVLPDSTAVEDCGLIWTCKQVNEELSSMVVAYAKEVIDQTIAGSTRLRASTSKSPIHVPYINTPSISEIRQLRAIRLAVSMDYSTPWYDSSNFVEDLQQQHQANFYTLFADLSKILSLHLPLVTIVISVNCCTIASVWEGSIRYSCLQICYWAFKNLEKQRPINVQGMIFDLSGNTFGPYYFPGHQPYIAFLARKLRKGRVRFAFLGHEPRPLSLGVYNIDGPVRPYENAKDMKMLNEIVRRSRLLEK